jgi:PKHD-type hydroxylase
MLYAIAPSPNFGITEQDFVTWNGGFTDEEISKIIELGDSLEKEDSKIDAGEVSPKNVRISDISWIHPSENNVWIFNKLSWILRQLNGQFYRFNITGFNESIQYTTYYGKQEEGGHYRWHADHGQDAPRKLSMVLQLSDPSEYEGGNLEILSSQGEVLTVDKKKGFLAMFPSFKTHRVTPVTSGTRKSLVVWATGPAFV